MKTDEAGGAASGVRLEPTLPGTYYRDPGVLEAEWERIFFRSWLYAGREERIVGPGGYRTLQAGPESILLLRGQDGVLRAFYNVCRHRGSTLCADEAGTLKAIRCPYHAWTYGLDGRLMAVPNFKGPAFPKEDYALHSVASRSGAAASSSAWIQAAGRSSSNWARCRSVCGAILWRACGCTRTRSTRSRRTGSS